MVFYWILNDTPIHERYRLAILGPALGVMMRLPQTTNAKCQR